MGCRAYWVSGITEHIFNTGYNAMQRKHRPSAGNVLVKLPGLFQSGLGKNGYIGIEVFFILNFLQIKLHYRLAGSGVIF